MGLTLNDVCSAIVDCEHKTAPTQSEGYPSIRTPNIGRGRLILEGVNRVSDETYEQWTQRMQPMAGDLILAREAPIGNVAIVPSGLKVCLGQRTVLIRANRAKVLPEYLVYLMLGDEIQGRIHSQSNGATVHHLNMKDIRGLVLPQLPSVANQRRIASILSVYDDLIENNTRRIAILEEMARRIYEEWFVRFRFPGHAGVRMVESELGLVPQGWRTTQLDDLYRTGSGGTPSRDHPEYFGGDIKWVKTKELNDGYLLVTEECITDVGLAKSSAKVFPRDTVLIAMYGATIGKLGILSTPAATNQACCAVVPKDSDFSAAYAFLTFIVRRQELIDMRAGAAQQNINQITIRQFQMLAPPSEVLVWFNRVVQPMLLLSECLQRKNAILRATRDLLLPKLISGELDVSALSEPEARAA